MPRIWEGFLIIISNLNRHILASEDLGCAMFFFSINHRKSLHSPYNNKEKEEKKLREQLGLDDRRHLKRK